MSVRDDVLRIVDEVANAWAEAIEKDPNGEVPGLDPYVDRILAVLQPRTWFGEAQAAFDQALTALPDDGSFPEPAFWLQRAQAAAAMASAEQQRVANLIAWKQLQATRQASSSDLIPLSTVDDSTTEIEHLIGLEP